ncbi:MAG: amidohydrolase family protein [Acidobacteria bacterium]|nr:amidohydrolase family protein [Acidobacteriota bacterium]
MGAAALGACADAPEPEAETQPAGDGLDGRIIDGHVHVWTSDVAAYPLPEGRDPAAMKPPSFTPEELFAHCKPVGVNRINLIQMSFYGSDHSYMLAAIEKYPENFAGTGLLLGITDEGSTPVETMLDLARHKVSAFRIGGGQYSKDGAGEWMDHPKFEAIYKAGTEHNLAPSFLVGPEHLPEIGRMSERFPDTPVIIDHIARIGAGGKPPDPAHIDALTALAKHPRILLKLGAFYALSSEGPPYTDLLPLIRRMVEAFGPERCMWETDCPYQVQPPHTYAASLALIRERADFLSASDKENILVRTAEKFFFER